MSEQVQAPVAESAARASSWRTAADIIGDLVRTVIYRPIRYGTLALGPHSAGIVGIAWAVTIIYAATVVSILLANPLRARTALQSQIDLTSNLVVPVFLLPAVLCLIGISFGLLLAGSQRAPWWRRILYLVVVAAVLGAITIIASVLGAGGALNGVAVGLLILIAAYVVLVWAGHTRPAVDAVVLTALTCTTMLVSYRSLAMQALLGSAGEQVITTVALILQQVATLALPVAFLSGINATALGISIVSWGAEEVGRRLRLRVSLILATTVVGAQWFLIARAVTADPDALPIRLSQLLAAGLLVGMCWAVWRMTNARSTSRDTSPDDVTRSGILVAVPLSYGVTSAAFIAAVLGTVVIALQLGGPSAAADTFSSLLDVVGSTTFTTVTRIAVVVGLVLAAILLARSGRRLLAGVSGIYAVVLGSFYLVMIPPEWFWTPSAVGDLGLVVTTVAMITWTFSRSWSRGRVSFALVLGLLSALIRQADFFSVPLGFLIGASATALLIVGLVWGFLTDGGEAHENSPRFPGDRQLLVLFGTFLFGIAIVAWSVIGKVVETTLLLSEVSLLALQTLGTALIIIVVFEASGLARRAGINGGQPRPKDG